MHSAGLELTKLAYTRLEDNNLIRHRGDRLSQYTTSRVSGGYDDEMYQQRQQKAEQQLTSYSP